MHKEPALPSTNQNQQLPRTGQRARVRPPGLRESRHHAEIHRLFSHFKTTWLSHNLFKKSLNSINLCTCDLIANYFSDVFGEGRKSEGGGAEGRPRKSKRRFWCRVCLVKSLASLAPLDPRRLTTTITSGTTELLKGRKNRLGNREVDLTGYGCQPLVLLIDQTKPFTHWNHECQPVVVESYRSGRKIST